MPVIPPEGDAVTTRARRQWTAAIGIERSWYQGQEPYLAV